MSRVLILLTLAGITIAGCKDVDALPATPERQAPERQAPERQTPEPVPPLECSGPENCPIVDSVPQGCAVAQCIAGSCTYKTRDGDGDGSYAKICTLVGADGTLEVGEDCDDEDPSVNPGAWDGPQGAGPDGPLADACNARDDDCDNHIDNQQLDGRSCECEEGQKLPCDEDILGAHVIPTSPPLGECTPGIRFCEDGRWTACINTIGPTPETCDALDNDCDGDIDEDASDPQLYYCDRDKDDRLHKDAVSRETCPTDLTGCENGQWLPYVENGFDDCDDAHATAFPGAPEVCNGRDDDCDGQVDDGIPPVSVYEGDLTCQGGDLHLTCRGQQLSCDGNIQNGCETNGTTIDNCHACGATCSFSCIATGCDEIASVSAGGSHSCALTSVGRPVCWGSNALGQLGDAQNTSGAAYPAYVDGLPGPAKEVFAHLDNTCAIVGDERVLYCWGDNYYQQLGTAAARTKEFSLVPEPVDNVISYPARFLSGVKTVALSGSHACAVHAQGHVACWGLNGDSQVRDRALVGDKVLHPTPILRPATSGPDVLIEDAIDVVVGDYHTCLLNASRTVECWGANFAGQTGLETTTDPVNSPRAVAGVSSVRQVVAGNAFSCAALENGDVYCWGGNDLGQLGTEGPGTSTPTKVPAVSNARRLSAGANHVCAISEPGGLICWGANSYHQSGAPVEAASVPPHPVDASVVQSSGGSAHTCAVDSRGRALCWGNNIDGQLATGASDGDPHPVPTVIRPLR